MDNICAPINCFIYSVFVCESCLEQFHLRKQRVTKVLLNYINFLLVVQIPHGASDPESAILEIKMSNSGSNIASDASNEYQWSFIFCVNH